MGPKTFLITVTAKHNENKNLKETQREKSRDEALLSEVKIGKNLLNYFREERAQKYSGRTPAHSF